ncbi:MAG: carbohydrate kinase [Stenotrophomonas acidaminiphila]|nr:MAG: carbohydrate kinase [Stenotrophomonas acidaminiphila]
MTSIASPSAVQNAVLPRLLVFGEALTDLVRTADDHWRSVAGGACWNVARAASALGVPTGWAGAVSNDLFGDEIARLSRQAGLDMRFLQVVPKAPLIAVVHELDPPRYFFLGNDTADLAFEEALLPAGWEDACQVAHFGCISLVRQPLGARLLAIAERLHARGVRISFDPNCRNLMGADYPPLFERLASLADVIKLSDEDLAHIYPSLGVDAGLAKVRSVAPDAEILYTRGAAGLALHAGAQVVEQPAFRVEVVDTVGAGDACIGAFLSSRLLRPGLALKEHARFAAACAALACTRQGAFAPSSADVRRQLSGA